MTDDPLGRIQEIGEEAQAALPLLPPERIVFVPPQPVWQPFQQPEAPPPPRVQWQPTKRPEYTWDEAQEK